MINKKRTSKKKKQSYVKLCDVYAEDVFIDTLCIGEGFRFLSSGKNCSQEELDELVEDRITLFIKCHKEKQRLYTKEEANRQEKHLRELEDNFEEITEEFCKDNDVYLYDVKVYRVSDEYQIIVIGSPSEFIGQKMHIVKPELHKMCMLFSNTDTFGGEGSPTMSPAMIKRAIKKHVLGESK